jgi:uncharacterized protein (DUF1330 family)
MSYNGSGTFNINTPGQPVVTGTTISSTAFNSLTADLATGLSTALTKDGQTTPTANLTLGGYKITNLGLGTVSTDAARMSQLQSGGATYITVTGSDNITGTLSPSLTAYTTGGLYTFIVATTNTTTVTLNIDGLGAKVVNRSGSYALVAGDLVTGQVVLVEYDGTKFQLINSTSYQVVRVTGTGYSPNIALTDAATVAWDTSTGQTATFTFVSTNRTMGAPTNLKDGAFYALAVIQNAGSNTLTWNSVFKWTAGAAPTLSTAASAKDYFVFRSDGTNLYEQGRSQAVA